mgnify:CR=1 FL=1
MPHGNCHCLSAGTDIKLHENAFNVKNAPVRSVTPQYEQFPSWFSLPSSTAAPSFLEAKAPFTRLDKGVWVFAMRTR